IAQQSAAAVMPDAVPGRIVVRYQNTIDQCVHCLIEHRQRLSARPASTVDALHAALRVHAARPLFGAYHDAHGRPTAITPRERSAAAAAAFAQRTARARTTGVPDLGNVYVLEVPEDTDVIAASQLLAADPDVVYAHPDYIVHLAATPNDPFLGSTGSWHQDYPDLWGLYRTNALAAWD